VILDLTCQVKKESLGTREKMGCLGSMALPEVLVTLASQAPLEIPLLVSQDHLVS